ncbi:MAG: adenylate/guanylate cyclase domain-containing protein, partial [Nostoc sp.]
EASLGGERRRMTVSFCDIANFTTLSERVSPEELVHHMADYFGPLSDDIHATGGTVDKYIGDAIMAVYGAPITTGRDPENAVGSAVQMLSALHLLNQGRVQR